MELRCFFLIMMLAIGRCTDILKETYRKKGKVTVQIVSVGRLNKMHGASANSLV